MSIRRHGVIAVATSVVAASLLQNGRTAHSLFKIPIPCYSGSACNISMETKIADTIRYASLIIWDKLVMCGRYCIEAVDRTAVDNEIFNCSIWKKSVLFSGDFGQILPVVPRGPRGMIVFMFFKSSLLY